MGAVFGILLGIPIGILWMIISPFIGFFTGADTTQVVLPYDESSGLVWEYSEYHDAYARHTDTKIENDKQIFTFKLNYFVFDKGNGGMTTEIVFTDKNGNSQTYYIASDTLEIKALAPGEYVAYSHTAKAEETVNGAYWKIASKYSTSAELLVYQPVEKGEEAVFTIVYPLDDEYIGQQRAIAFTYMSGRFVTKDHENEELIFKVSEDGVFNIIRVLG